MDAKGVFGPVAPLTARRTNKCLITSYAECALTISYQNAHVRIQHHWPPCHPDRFRGGIRYSSCKKCLISVYYYDKPFCIFLSMPYSGASRPLHHSPHVNLKAGCSAPSAITLHTCRALSTAPCQICKSPSCIPKVCILDAICKVAENERHAAAFTINDLQFATRHATSTQ